MSSLYMSGCETSGHRAGSLVHFDGHRKDTHQPLCPSFCNDAGHRSTKTLCKSLIGWSLVCALLIPKRNAVFLFKAINFVMQDILNLPTVSEEGFFSPQQGRGQEVLLSCIVTQTQSSPAHCPLSPSSLSSCS